MSAKSIRIAREARSLFWPWCLVIFAAALRLLDPPHLELYGRGPFSTLHNFIEAFCFLGFFLGLPLLATLSFGNEFQHRTLVLLLSQPIRRMEIWSEKFSVTVIAVVSAALVFACTWRSAFREDRELWVGAAALVLVMTASAPFWTLIARSSLGGVALNSVNSFIPLLITVRRDWFPQTAITRSLAIFLLLSYAGAMLWLGRRTLARFQATGGTPGDDLLMAGPRLTPPVIADWFRSRPTGLLLNLIRKEFRLLRPVWLLSLLGLIGWFCLPASRSTPEHASLPAMLLVLAFTPLIAVLAGTLSLGEERSSGTHSWHLTQPVSASRLWIIKLLIALFTSFICAVLVPALALNLGKFIFRSPLPFEVADVQLAWAFPVLLLTFASFWCACTVNGTVRAALCVFPVIIALALAHSFGTWIAPGTVAFLVSKIDFFSNFGFTNSVASFEPPHFRANPFFYILLWLVPTLLLAVRQSQRLFRRQIQDSTLPTFRNLLPLAAVLFLCTLLLMGFPYFIYQARQSMWSMFKETHEAIERLQPAIANLDAAHPLQLTGEDLAAAAPLSPRTRRWLLNSRITIAPFKPDPRRREYGLLGSRGLLELAPDQNDPWYLATIKLSGGSVCTVDFQAKRGWGILGFVCK